MTAGYRDGRFPPRRAAITLAVVVCVAVAALGGCARQGLLWVPDRDLNADLRRLTREMEETAIGPETADRRYALVAEIARTLRRGGEGGRERTFLTLYAQQHPQDPYNAAHLVTVADSYLEAGQKPLAVHYYRRVVRNQPDLYVRGRSLHLHCLERLVELDDPVRHVEYYRELVERFPERIDVARNLYRLAGVYFQQGAWEAALDTYGKFLRAPPTEIPGEPDAYRRVTELIRFHHSDKSWCEKTCQRSWRRCARPSPAGTCARCGACRPGSIFSRRHGGATRRSPAASGWRRSPCSAYTSLRSCTPIPTTTRPFCARRDGRHG